MMRRTQQRGVILMIALIVMVSMTLAAIALVRSVDTGILVAANLAFRQSATISGDTGLRSATNWLLSNQAGTTLHADKLDATSAYWASAQNAPPAFDPLVYDWESGNNSVCILAGCARDPVTGNVTRFVIHRLCDLAGNPIGVKCVRPPATSGSSNNSSKAVVSVGTMAMTATSAAYYRITVRITGPRNTTSYVQAVVY